MLKYNSYKPTEQETDFVGNLIKCEPNDISYIFFSDKNIENININLIERVKQITFERYGKKMQIQPQKKHIMVTIMRHVYLKNIKNKLDAMVEVDILNTEVMKQIVPTVITELIAQMRYIEDYNKNIIPLEAPQDSRSKIVNKPFSDLFDF
jgi:hypothetical protein